MAAGLGFKTFTTGEVLTAGDVNGYLMQGVLVFASEAARNAAITSPQEGQFAYTKDNNSLWYYTGSAWAASGATGDIEGVTAGVGISGGGTSGTVTVTNSMATAIDAKGDLVPGTGADTFARLAVGANGTVLTADSAEATGIKWAAPAGGGGLTLLATATPSAAASFQFTSISGSYKNLVMYWKNFQASAGGTFATMKLNNDSSSLYDFQTLRIKSQGTNIAVDAADGGPVTSMMGGTSANQAFGGQFAGLAIQTAGRGWLRVWNYTGTGGVYYDWHSKSYDNTVPQTIGTHGWGGYNNSAAITQIDVTASGGTLTGTCYLYGES
jgi:hypothetical protein